MEAVPQDLVVSWPSAEVIVIDSDLLPVLEYDIVLDADVLAVFVEPESDDHL